jgi:Ser/Thr protein kinase RdoA (MazF antagonist)
MRTTMRETKPSATPYERLSPDTVLSAVEQQGIATTGSILALNSYENRVYQIGTDAGFVVAKFYRPGRWTSAAILEEHTFSLELAEQEIPVVPPMVFGGDSLFEHDGFRFALFERRGGRWPELGTSEERKWMGRFLGRIHGVGAVADFAERPTLSIDRLGYAPVASVQAGDWIPPHLTESYARITENLLDSIEMLFDRVGEVQLLRIHGDCHPGNVLWTDAGPHFVDLDDCMSGPAIQDLWLFLSGSRDEMQRQLGDLIEGYEQFRSFEYNEISLIEALRTLRIIHYAAWIAARWQDPAFPRAFPWFAETKFWEDHVLALQEQLAALNEPLSLG